MFFENGQTTNQKTHNHKVLLCFVLFGLRCSGGLWWMSPYQGWNLCYPKAGRRDPLHMCAGNQPLPLQGTRGICCFRALTGCRLATQSIIVPAYSAQHVGLLVESFWNNKPCAPVHPEWSAYQGYQVLLGNTPWRCVHPLALSRCDIFQSMACRRCVPSMYMCSQSIQSFVLNIDTIRNNKPLCSNPPQGSGSY